MIFLYNLAFLIFGIFYLPTFLRKSKQAESRKELIRQRLGILPEAWRKKISGKKVIWLHAVSVGEVLAMRSLIQRFLERSSEFHWVITTVTPTGQKVAQELEGERVSVCYAPFDLTFSVRRFFSVLKPECLLLAETEIWPNLLIEAERSEVPVGVVNARLSAKSEKKYSRFISLFRTIFKRLSFVLAQSEEDAGRFIRLGP